jgi:AcrR family transcriptional regulator
VETSDLSTRDVLVRTATTVFAEHGYHAVSVAGLCRRAGVANGTFYLYFQSKEEVFYAVVATAMQLLAIQLSDPVRDDMNLRDRERFDVEVMVSFIESRYDLFRILINEHNLRTEDRDSLMDMFAAQRSKELQAGLRKGLLRKDLDPQITAYAEIGLTNEVLARWVRDPTRFSRSQVIDELCRIRSRILFT